MSPQAAVIAAESLGASLRAKGETLTVQGASLLSPEIMAAIRANKPSVLALVRQRDRQTLGDRIESGFLQRLPQGEREQYESTVRALDAGQDPKERA